MNFNVLGMTVNTGEFILTDPQRSQLLFGLLQWFAGTEKIQSIDLKIKENAFKLQLQQLVNAISFKIDEHQNVVACAPGDAGETLDQIRYGTLWFKGWNNTDLRMLALVDSDTFVPMSNRPARNLPGVGSE